MSATILLLPILIPFLTAVLSLIIPKKLRVVTESISLLATFFNLLLAAILFKSNLSFTMPWAGFGIEFSLRLYNFSAFIMICLAGFGFLLMLYSLVFMRNKPFVNQFYAYFLLTLAFANAVVLADNLVFLLFFWEGLLLTIFGLISIGREGAFKTATKAFIIIGVTDLCMMLGIALTGYLAGTLTISKISLPLGGLSGLAFILLMIGAISKAGAMPFHSWIPDAATDAPLPFMALMPAAFEKLLGIYFLARITLDMFMLNPESGMSILLMAIGAITIILAVMMALIQKDFKKLLSYHAISQVGYMILGIGTAVPIGIVGGLFHMVNNALYKSGLFLAGGAVEKQTGTTNLEELGGLGRRMPITFICFIITAVSISGVPPFNGFFSKELVYDAALERGLIFYLAAVIGSFFTAASFLKLGHAAFLGKTREVHKYIKEVSIAMWLPMVVIALFCIFFGIFNSFPIDKLIQPIIVQAGMTTHKFSGFPANMMLVVVTVLVLIGALINHLWAVKKKGSALHAADHIHYAPVLSGIYDKAQKGLLDPYNIGMRIMQVIARAGYYCDRLVDWVYGIFVVRITELSSQKIRMAHNGNYSRYLGWSMVGLFLVMGFIIYFA